MLCTLLYHFQLPEYVGKGKSSHFLRTPEKFDLSSDEQGPCLPYLFAQLWYEYSVASMLPTGLSDLLAICPAQSTNTEGTFGACHEQTAHPRLTEHMEMQQNRGSFNPNTKPPAQVKGNKVSDREIFPKTPSDQPSLMKT